MPWQSALGHLLQEWVGVELLDVVHAWLAPQPFEEHHGSCHGRNAGRVAHSLHAGLFIGLVVVAVVVDVVGERLAVGANAAYAAADRGLTSVVLAEVLRIGQNGFEELQRYDFLAIVEHGVDASHADVLDYA